MSDLNLGNENIEINRSRFFWKIEFHRDDDTGGILAHAFFKDTSKIAAGPSSGSAIARNSFILSIPDEHVRVTGFGTFFNNFIDMCNNAMSNYYTTGSVAPESGSLNILDRF